MSHPFSVSIMYSPSPDDPISDDHEDCAAYQYACRAKEFLMSSTNKKESDGAWNVTVTCIQESSFEEVLKDDSNSKDDEDSPKMLLLLIQSCSADGSIHRLLRKSTKRLGQDGPSSSRKRSIPLVVALLGHARCENSAKQMKQTIYGAGRRIEKTLGANGGGFVSIHDRLETQVELVGPEEEFDPWWSSVIEKC